MKCCDTGIKVSRSIDYSEGNTRLPYNFMALGEGLVISLKYR